MSDGRSETRYANVSEEGSMGVVTRSLGLAATIQLHYPSPNHTESHARCRAAIREIVRLIRRDPRLNGTLDKIDFILGVSFIKLFSFILLMSDSRETL